MALKSDGPLLIACNHPNSFLDAVILDILFDIPVYSLARGDAFVSPFVSRILYSLKILPVYRTSEGVENLMDNYKTFNACIDLFKKNGAVLIFSEGLCVNEWKLRPLKKGTARLAYKCREENIPLKILPVAINYSSFRLFGKNVLINFGNSFYPSELVNGSDGAFNTAFNRQLREELEPLVITMDNHDKKKREALFAIQPSPLKKLLLGVPAAAGFLLHAPLYWPVRNMARRRFRDTVHYDSVITGGLFLLYPLYLLLITGILLAIFKTYYFLLLLILLPFTAWSYVQLKQQTD